MVDFVLMYEKYKISRESPGFFGYYGVFTRRRFIVALYLLFPPGVGIASALLEYLLADTGIREVVSSFIRDSIIFYAVIAAGVSGCLLFYRKAPVLNVKNSVLINIYGAGFFAVSFLLGRILSLYYGNEYLLHIFFILGGLLSYIVQFVIYFSFTTVETPLNIFLALVQSVVGIILFSLFTANLNLMFFIKAMVFFCSSALIFAVPYSKNMLSVSRIYREKTGIGGYNFVRAFVTSFLVDNYDDLIEGYFDAVGIDTSVKLRVLTFRRVEDGKIKGAFIVPYVHFGPFKTCGSAALTEEIYTAFGSIPGLSVFHTTTTHAENFTRHIYNKEVVDTITDIFKEKGKGMKVTRVPGFSRFKYGSAKVLGTVFGDVPVMFITRHPQPSDDIVPSVALKIAEDAKAMGYAVPPIIIDAHNSILGDEILISENSKEAAEIIAVSRIFLEKFAVSLDRSIQFSEVLYGAAYDPMEDYGPEDGIGRGGIRVHLFRIDDRTCCIVHFDGNNAIPEVREALVNLAENMGIDRIEVTTSDSHTVARVLSAQGYYPIGKKITISEILPRVERLIEKAVEDMEPVCVVYTERSVDNVRVWGDLSYFDIVLDTIESALGKSKQLLTFGLLLPTFFSLLIATFYFEVRLPL